MASFVKALSFGPVRVLVNYFEWPETHTNGRLIWVAYWNWLGTFL
jgi:hypothetical protein